jgi:hypothetical protein
VTLPLASGLPACHSGLDDYGVIGIFHDGVVYGFRRRREKSPFIQADEVEVAARCGQGRLGCLENVLAVLAQFFQITRRLEHKHAAGPVKPAGSNELARTGFVGFLDEPCDPIAIRRMFQRLAALYVAIACFRFTTDDAESHQPAIGRR